MKPCLPSEERCTFLHQPLAPGPSLTPRGALQAAPWSPLGFIPRFLPWAGQDQDFCFLTTVLGAAGFGQPQVLVPTRMFPRGGRGALCKASKAMAQYLNLWRRNKKLFQTPALHIFFFCGLQVARDNNWHSCSL